MTVKLFLNAIIKFILGVVLVALLLFLPAGTLRYPNGWLFMSILFVPMFAAGIVMMIKNPELLRKRLSAKETQAEQSLVIKLSGLMFIAGFVLAGLTSRFGWLPLPQIVSCIATILFLLAYLLYAEVLRENTYLSRTIEVQKNQTVIDTGLYGIVILFLAMPLVLGSLLSFAVFLFYPMLIAKRIRNEEQVLEAELDGYTNYKKKVRYRLIPFVW